MKFKKLLFVLAATSVLTLTGCDEIEARLPKEVEDAQIVQVDGVYNNNLGQIWDALVNPGSSNSQTVMNNVLLKIAESKFGKFYGEGGLREAAEAELLANGSAKMNAFLAAHSAYVTDDVATAAEKVINVYNQIIQTIQESFWSVIKGSSYQERSRFMEELFVTAMRGNLYSIDLPDNALNDEWSAPKLFNGHDTYRNAPDYLIHYDDGTPAYLDVYEDYIQRSMLESHYRQLLVEKYLFEKNYSSLGRSYARRVQYVSVADVDGTYGATYRLVTQYAKLVLEREAIGETFTLKDASTVTMTEALVNEASEFGWLDTIYRGYLPVDDPANPDDLTKFAYYLLENSGFISYPATFDGVGNVLTYRTFEQTEYGKMVKDFYELTTDRWTTGSSTDFTGGGKYDKETGLEIKTREIQSGSSVVEGWYQSTELSELPSNLKSRLFKMGVANEVDYVNDRLANPNATQGDYVWNLGGDYFLIPDSYQPVDETPYCLYDSGKWYFIKIEEAVKASKLTMEGGYATDDRMVSRAGKLTQHEIALALANKLAESDTYIKAANEYFIEQTALEFHDDQVYDYFKTTFPDLFDK